MVAFLVYLEVMLRGVPLLLLLKIEREGSKSGRKRRLSFWKRRASDARVNQKLEKEGVRSCEVS